MTKVSDLFEIYNGNNLALVDLEEDSNGVNYISRSSVNNGVAAKVLVSDDISVFEKGLISVSCNGSILASFVQPEPFVTSKDVKVLKPKEVMSDIEKWFYCYCLRTNAVYFSYGRIASTYLQDIKLPDKIPDWVYNCKSELPRTKVNSETPELITTNWKSFKLGDLFNITKGTLSSVPEDIIQEGIIAIITSSDLNHGISGYLNNPIITDLSDCLTVASTGSIGACFYQSGGFAATNNVNILHRHNISVYSYLFVSSLIQKIRCKFSYGYIWNMERMKNTEIKLPATSTGEPDWNFMELYMKSLPYSDLIKDI